MIWNKSRIDDTYVSDAEWFIGDEKIQKMVRTTPDQRGDVLFKSSSVDFIPTSLIKLCPLVFSEIIATLANLSFSQGIFPTKFKDRCSFAQEAFSWSRQPCKLLANFKSQQYF